MISDMQIMNMCILNSFFCLQAYKTHLATQGHTASLRGLKMKLANKIGLIRNTQRRSQNRLTKQMEIDGKVLFLLEACFDLISVTFHENSNHGRVNY